MFSVFAVFSRRKNKFKRVSRFCLAMQLTLIYGYLCKTKIKKKKTNASYQFTDIYARAELFQSQNSVQFLNTIMVDVAKCESACCAKITRDSACFVKN